MPALTRVAIHPDAAGGFDAVFCLVASAAARESVYQMWASWSETAVTPLLAEASAVGLALSIS